MEKIPRHKWITTHHEESTDFGEGFTFQECINCDAKRKVKTQYLGTTNVSSNSVILEGTKYCNKSKRPLPSNIGVDIEHIETHPKGLEDMETPKPTHTNAPIQAITADRQLEKTVKFMERYGTTGPIIKMDHQAAREFEELVMINLAYEELVKHGIRGRVRDILGRYLYSRGYQEKVKSLENG